MVSRSQSWLPPSLTPESSEPPGRASVPARHCHGATGRHGTGDPACLRRASKVGVPSTWCVLHGVFRFRKTLFPPLFLFIEPMKGLLGSLKYSWLYYFFYYKLTEYLVIKIQRLVTNIHIPLVTCNSIVPK